MGVTWIGSGRFSAGGGGGATPAWVQAPSVVSQGGFGNPSTTSFGATTTNGSCVGVAFTTGSGNTPTSVVGNLSGGGTVALTQRVASLSSGGGGLTIPGEDFYLYTVDSASPITSISISLTSASNPVTSVFEASTATYDASQQTTNTAVATEHTATVTTTATDDVIGVFGYIASSSINSVHSGYAQNGATYFGYFSVSSTSATGAAGSKTTGFTPLASTSSNQYVYALKGA